MQREKQQNGWMTSDTVQVQRKKGRTKRMGQRKRLSDLPYFQVEFSGNSSLTSVLTVYMSALAARELQRSVIIIYLFRMWKGKG